MKNIGLKLYNELIQDNSYQDYCQMYKQDHYIDKNAVERMLITHKDYYYLFLKSFIWLYYKEDIKYLNKELQDFRHIRNVKITLDDFDIVLKHYYYNYNRCKKCIKIIISNKLRPNSELKLLKLIYNRDINKDIVPSMSTGVDNNVCK